MIAAKAMTDEEVKAAAGTRRNEVEPWIKVVEAATVPKTASPAF
jgi:hypothetical protein